MAIFYVHFYHRVFRISYAFMYELYAQYVSTKETSAGVLTMIFNCNIGKL